MTATLISASNILNSKEQSTSYKLCILISKILERNHITCEIIDLREHTLLPCTGCGKCYDSKRCSLDKAFNAIYEKAASSNFLFFISPHYAPIPAKLCMLLEKMEQITFLHWWKNNSYQSELYRIPTGIISHGGGSDWALSSYKAMVNDTIANALDTIQCSIVPYDEDWNTGIALPVATVTETDSIFPIQKYDWDTIEIKLNTYIQQVLQKART